MLWFDWLIVIVPVIFVLWMGYYSRRYLKDVTAFLSAGRVCGRYVIAVGDIANALSIIGLLSYVEVHYKTGFSLGFWHFLMTPVGVVLGLYGYCTYRYRETKSQSIGQFIEIRYSRNLRIFAAALRSISEMLCNMIMPALAARFFMYFLGFPDYFTLFGISFSTFDTIMVIVLTAAISIICMGGSLSIIVTDTLQGFICYPLMTLFAVFVLYKFSWSNEILPVLANRAKGESFLNPYEIYNLRDFNYFSLIVSFAGTFLHRMSWAGGGGSSTAAKSPHEQKMASLLGTWRGAIGSIFYLLIAIALLVFMNHQDFAQQSHNIRVELTTRIANSLVKDPKVLNNVLAEIKTMPVEAFKPGVDKPLSEKANIDTRYLNRIHKQITGGTNPATVVKMDSRKKGKKNSLFQQFRTLYYQQMAPVSLRQMLPPGMLGLFCLLMILAMVSTDDSRIFSATITISQDVILPFFKKQLTPKQHIWMLRIVAICIGVFFFFGSKYMAQLDYINLYSTLTCSMWLGGCGPMLIFGLYSRYGTTLGAWVSLVTGMVMAIGGALIQRNWADIVYPWLTDHNLVNSVGETLASLSKPFEPIVVWRMDAIKCPVNSYEWYLITMLVTLALYWIFSWISCKEPYNLERMLHRGEYATDGVRQIKSVWTWKNLYNKLIGITPEYTLGDKVIAWGYFIYSIGYRLFGTFVLAVVWNIFYPWTIAYWGNYFLIVHLIVPGAMAAFTAVWFGICGTIDLKNMFRDLEARVANALDDGRVEGNMSLADKAAFEKIDAKAKEKK